MLQDWPPVSTFEVLEKVPVPGLMLNMPPPVARVLHVPPSWVTSWIPAGIVSLNWTVDTGKAFGLVTVMVPVEVPLRKTVDGPKLLLIAGASACAPSRPAERRAKRAMTIVIGVEVAADLAEWFTVSMFNVRGVYTRSSVAPGAAHESAPVALSPRPPCVRSAARSRCR